VKSERFLLGAALAAAVAFVAIGLQRPIWADDADAIRVARLGLAGIVTSFRNDNGLPVYFFVLSLWMRVFGESEIAVRLLSAMFYLAGAGTVGVLAWDIYRNRRAAVYSALLYLASAQMIRQAHAVRAYSLLGLLTAASLLWHGRRKHAAWAIVTTLGLLTHIWFFFVLFAEGVCDLLWRRDNLKRLAMPPAVFAIAWGPIFAAQLHNGSTHWFRPFQASYIADVFVQFYEYRELALVLLGACVVAVALADRTAFREFFGEQGTRAMALVAGMCAGVPLAISIFRPIYYPGRYTTIALPALAVLMGAILARFAPRVYAQALCYAMLLAGLAMAVSTRGGTTFGNLPAEFSDRSTMEYILAHAARGDALVFTCLTRTSADYYLRRNGAEGRFVEASFPEELDRHPGWRDNAAMLQHSEALDAEAADVASRLAELARGGHRVWVYYGQDLEVADRLKSALDRKLILLDQRAVRGPCHIFVLEYGARPDADGRESMARGPSMGPRPSPSAASSS
jgi:hypothetical protein